MILRNLALAGALIAAGCAGYRLGPSNGALAGDRSVEIQIFKNKTLEPRLSEPVAQALRARIQEDATYRLATHGDADVIVSGEIRSFTRTPLSFQPNDVITTRDYDAKITAHVRAVERGSGRVIFERDFHGRSTIEGGLDLPSAERQADPILAADLARNIASALVDGTW